MQMKFNPHTIIMLIGPTECGKSTFSEQILIPNLQFSDLKSGYRSNVQYLSSDKIRQNMLGYPYDKYNENMLEVSKQAFEMLYMSLEQLTSYPVNADFVIVDTIGLAEDHRASVRDIAQKNGYDIVAVVFDYRKREDYYNSLRSKDIISKHIRRLKEEVLAKLSKEGYQQIIRIKEKNFLANPEVYDIEVDQLQAYLDCQLPLENNYMVIGDVHEQIDALKTLIIKNGYSIDADNQMHPIKEHPVKFILIGDYIDKGGNTKETIEFLYQNRTHFYLVIGNHEQFDYLWLHNQIAKKSIDDDFRQAYFSAISILEADSELQRKFFALVESAKPFLHYTGLHRSSFYVTHAPCQIKYIGKISTKAKRRQRNFRLDREASIEKQLAFLSQEHQNNFPYYFFGHVMSKTIIRLGRTIGLDTGAGNNHTLTAANIFPKRLEFQTVEIEKMLIEDIPTLFPYEKRVKPIEMTEALQNKISYFTKNKINYFAGTISPADKQADVLESLEAGLEYFHKHGVNEVTLQPKYMGSRCTIYLNREIDKCYATSRRGYIIKQVDLTVIYQDLLHRLTPYFTEHDIEMLLIDGELMPWKALGTELIDFHFSPIAHALEQEQQTLAQSGFYQLFQQILETDEYQAFVKDSYHINKKALIEKYDTNKYQTYNEALKLAHKVETQAKQMAAIQKYQKQLAIYAHDEALHYKPFAILKTIYTNGTESLPAMSTAEMYALLNDDAYLNIDLTSADGVTQANDFFATLTTTKQMEGVVIKPLHHQDMLKAVPFMKVRNPDYLTLIYGYDYQFEQKYKKLLNSKKIGRKIRASIAEYKLGQALLSIPYQDITTENQVYTDTVSKLLGEMEKESALDPRL